MIATTTTLNRLRNVFCTEDKLDNLIQSLGKTEVDDEPLTLLHILESNGIVDAITALRAIDDCPEKRLFAVRCVRQMPRVLTDTRILDALDVAELHAIGEASDEELEEAQYRACGADGAAVAAQVATQNGSWFAASEAAWAAAVAVAAEAAHAETWGGDGTASYDEARAAQERDFRDIFCTDDTLP